MDSELAIHKILKKKNNMTLTYIKGTTKIIEKDCLTKSNYHNLSFIIGCAVGQGGLAGGGGQLDGHVCLQVLDLEGGECRCIYQH